MIRPRDRRGTAVGNALVVLSLLVLGAALIYPRIRSDRFRSYVDTVIGEVDQVREQALAHLSETGTWPAGADPGEVPPELASKLPTGFSFRGDRHMLDWDRWETVRVVEPEPPLVVVVPLADDEVETDTLPPPPSDFGTLASLAVHSADEGLLASLLARYGGATSFVHDTTWTLVMPLRAPRRRP